MPLSAPLLSPLPEHRHPAVVVLIAGLAVAGPTAVHAAGLGGWPPGGVQLCQVCQGGLPVIVPDGAGGGFVAWQDLRNGNDDIYAQRVTASGEIATGWPIDGVPVCTNPRAQFLTIANPAVSDGSGGFIIPWIDYRDFVPGGTLEDIYAQRILADGSVAPGWPADGLPVRRAPARDSGPVLISDGAGGAFMSWTDFSNYDIYVQRVTTNGAVAPGWPADGLPVSVLPDLQLIPQLAPDGAGGVIVAWEDWRDGPPGVYAQRITASGQIATGWPEDGIRIVQDRAFRGLISDGTGGAYLASSTPGAFADRQYHLQRFMGDGSMAPGWPAEGVPVCVAPDERTGLWMVPDGVGGALLAWSDYRDFADNEIFALRMRPDGSRHPGWPVDGLRVSDNTALDDAPDLAPDGMGGVYLVWDHYTGALGSRVWVQHLTGAGTVAAGWLAGGVEIPSDVSCPGRRVVEDGMGGAIVAWAREDGGMRALRFQTDGPVPVAIALVSAEAEPGLVRLAWQAPGGMALRATVERRTESGDWHELGSITPDGTGRILYEDRSVTPDTRYGYRLGYLDGGTLAYTAEIRVTTPLHRLALLGLSPNPSAGDPIVEFSLTSGEPAALEIYDIHGRRRLTRDLGSRGPGSHSLRLELSGRLAAGVYTVRLRQGRKAVSARAVIMY